MSQTSEIEQKAVESIDSVGHPANSVSDTGKALAALNARIDDIVTFQKRKEPWFRDTSFIISSAAFMISLLTSGISAYRTYRQDINSRKDALQSTIQQYYATSLANVANQFAFQKDLNGPNDPKSASSQYFAGGANTIVQNANVAFAKQALSLVNELGRNASSVDLGETAVVLGSVNQFSAGSELYKKAIDNAINSVEYLGATRGLAAQQYYLGDKDDSLLNMKKALDVFSKFPGENNNEYVNYTTAQTYLFWAGFVRATDCKLSNENISQASHYVELLSPIVRQGSGMDAQIALVKTAVGSCAG
jgi:hypothetical protein